ncbi:MAG TPA: excinuclease ABC subunit UvrB [bacterium]|nr:excinuclease ABC subunit UvrB [bacterium]
MPNFQLISNFSPRGDQPRAIKALVKGLRQNKRFQVLLGVTGSGKTYTMAGVIEELNKPTLIISHNKTLAAQLYGEFKSFFPKNAVEYFISYYDYYQPEAYIPTTDTYIEKDTSINEEIERLRLKATSSLMVRSDVIIVASVSCIYGLGSPQDFRELFLLLKTGDKVRRDKILRMLVDIHYTRNDIDFHRGTFRVRGDVIDIYPAYEEHAVRVELWGDTVEKISIINPLTGKSDHELECAGIYPAKHFVTTPDKLNSAVQSIQAELKEQLRRLHEQNKLLEAQRLESRTHYDLEMLREVGYCSGIENYSRHLTGRKEGESPACLIDYFPDEFLMIIDESHATIPQIRAMYNGDRARKETLVEHGFRLPSALDNRPLKFEEFEKKIHRAVFVSATPAEYEMEKTKGEIVEQVIRPTGLMDPEVQVRPTKSQIDDLVAEIRRRTVERERVLVTTLTKRMAEDLTDYLNNLGLRVRYLHSEIDALDRVEILRGLRLAEFDILVGINLLREGLDLPEVSLVAILDADKEGFLRSERSLMQTAGRAARNVNGMVILYADRITEAIRFLQQETERRRRIQAEYNQKHGIKPETVYKTADEVMAATAVADARVHYEPLAAEYGSLSALEKEEIVEAMGMEMLAAAENLEFEKAAHLRDEIAKLQGKQPVHARRKGRIQ